ncbi:SDR family NAD(P)-dependent oxidoreductase [Kutzneria buriramensis]|uniref:3-oxoacyl-[acyl-carrier protein] reductase n=1 Tax=Kutzneria buriramensis TaxID=1045776 RepID=A0A3E0HLW2_9PSEU|nr:SDR family NAD(P)-dependent oxidoreductase [Kutzneria buriramensis]REH47025.1 3-oxoacyl-[acyl-carrier protein] reductase [Kutzneria buriramensis]
MTAGVAQPTDRARPPELAVDRTIDRALVHRASVAEAFVTDIQTVGGLDYVAAATCRSGDPPEGTFGVRCDVTDTESVQRAYDEVLAQQGPVQVLMCNAGVTKGSPLLGMSEKDFVDVIDTNLLGAMRAVKACLHNMVRARWGRIILIGSSQALWGSPGVTNYAASKAALAGFARSLA